MYIVYCYVYTYSRTLVHYIYEIVCNMLQGKKNIVQVIPLLKNVCNTFYNAIISHFVT